MHSKIFKNLIDLIELNIFESEWQKQKLNPFNEKWLHCSLTTSRTKTLRKFLTRHIKVILRTEHGEKFYNLALRNYVKIIFPYFLEDIDTTDKLNQSLSHEDSQLKKRSLLHTLIHYRMTLDDLFILLTNVTTWEHKQYPVLLEYALIKEFQEKNSEFLANDDIMKYYIRLLDVLSSPRIATQSDLETLQVTVQKDWDNWGTVPLNSLSLYEDWTLTNVDSLLVRFPNFKPNLEKKLFATNPPNS
jgi:hypothetical protein